MTSYQPADGRYDTMRYRRVGRSGLLLPAISLGLWQNFGTDRPEETQRAIIRRAFDRGVTHFDLANNYADDDGRLFGHDQLEAGAHARMDRRQRLSPVHDLGVSIVLVPVYALAAPAEMVRGAAPVFPAGSIATTLVVSAAVPLALARRTPALSALVASPKTPSPSASNST